MLDLPSKTPTIRRILLRVGALALVGAIASVLVASFSPDAAHADDSQSFSGAPAYKDHVDPNRTRFNGAGDPGQSISDVYFVENSGTLPQEVSIYATDAFNSEDGTFSLLEGSEAPKDAGSWVSFSGSARQVIFLEPHTSMVIPFTISIPADAKPGDHVGGVIASVISPDGQVKLERRVATRLYVRVSGEIQSALNMSGLDATYEPSLNPFDGKVILTYTVQNTGNVVIGADAESSVSGLFGTQLSGNVASQVPELLPGQSHVGTISIPGVAQWVWMNASTSLFGKSTPGTVVTGPLVRVQREASLWAVPWALLILLVIAAFVYFYIRFSRVNNERRSQQWLEYTEAEASLRAREETPES
jgi:hypothetical protein